MKIINSIKILIVLGFFGLMLNSCDKTKVYETTIPQSSAHFLKKSLYVRYLNSEPKPVINVQVGTTDVSSVDRTVTYTFAPTSGAVAGTNFTVAGGTPTGTITIPAGQAIGNIPLQLLTETFTADSRDTLIIYLSEPSIPTSFNDTLRIFLKENSLCDENNPDIEDFLGDYEATENAYGSVSTYTVTVSSVTPINSTSAKIGIDNVWNSGWGTIYYILDWSTNPGTVTTVSQTDIPGSNSGDLSSTYAGIPFMIRDHPAAGPGEFTSCGLDGATLDLYMQLGPSGIGYFGNVFNLYLQR